ncbi:hypothetical protein EXU57_04330 [Segetibacter sp. 3557_3]|uniref:hypothetical protein n=1 Tax=Segetibacter sp. 3557_3 TaxID=2547429 RepID=UPI001058979F|nr:hypothetical protein [Segetibacter sp. 3557_3]TDH29297.1 hypothetical protein EXU57_04330 [Segetibacter sp. 3557_3]
MYKLVLLLVTVGLISSCKKPVSFEYRDMKNFKVSNWGFDRSTVSLDLVYFNPNNFEIDLKNVNCDVYLENNFVGKFTLDTLMHIQKHSEFSLPASMEVDMKNVFKNTLNVLFNKEVLVGAKGSTRVGKSGLFINMPFNYEGKHKVDLF